MRHLTYRSALVIFAVAWLVGQLLPGWQAATALAAADACASPGFVFQRAPLSAGFDAERAAPVGRFGGEPLNPQTFPPADLSVTIVDSPDPILPGNNLTYTITVHNDGPGDGPGLLTTAVPAGTTFVSMNEAGISGCWFCSSTPAVGATGPITCDSSIFPVAESEEFTLVVQLTGNAPALSPLQLTAVVSGEVSDSSTGNNTALALTTVIAPTPTVTLTPTATVISQTPVPTATATPPPTKSTSDDKSKPKTDTQRQQDDHSNQLGRDDYHTEGNVVEVVLDANPPYAMIATRDGLVQVLLRCDGGCPAVRPGDYVQVDGVKENEGLFTAEDISVSR